MINIIVGESNFYSIKKIFTFCWTFLIPPLGEVDLRLAFVIGQKFKHFLNFFHILLTLPRWLVKVVLLCTLCHIQLVVFSFSLLNAPLHSLVELYGPKVVIYFRWLLVLGPVNFCANIKWVYQYRCWRMWYHVGLGRIHPYTYPYRCVIEYS